MTHGVSLTVADSVATILIDRADKRNALSLDEWRALLAFVDQAETDSAVCLIVVRGAHGHFSAGNDITGLCALRGEPEAAKAFGAAMADAMIAIELSSKPVIMAIEGSCYGAAVALALAGDLRIATDDAAFAITPAKLGALYLRSDLHRLVAAIGQGQARTMIYSAAPIMAERAEQIGLVDAVIAKDRFEAEIAALTQTVLRGSPFTLRRSKEMLRTVGHAPTPLETEESLANFVEATQGPDFEEGVSAFLEGRRPQFR